MAIYGCNGILSRINSRACPKHPRFSRISSSTARSPSNANKLHFTLWADDAESDARANLRRHLHDLKHALPPKISWLLSDAETIQWNPDAPFYLDVAEFENFARKAETLADAVALYQGDLCANLYDDWLSPERERLREKYISVLERLIETTERTQNPRAALEYTQQLARYDPLREETYRAWMRLLAQSGDRAGLVRAYNLCVTVLARELNVEPDVETKRLYEQLLSVRVARAPQTIPPLTLARPQHNLPHVLTPLIGRENETNEIYKELRATRLMTLTGVGVWAKRVWRWTPRKPCYQNFPTARGFLISPP